MVNSISILGCTGSIGRQTIADKSFLVCKRDTLFLVDDGKRRLESDRARHRRHNAVG